jgi:FkbM family methyltransferase
MSIRISKIIYKYFPKTGFLLRSFLEHKGKLNSKFIKTKWGFYLAGNPDMATGNFEQEETRVVLSLLDEVNFFINIGANIGYYTCHALSKGKRSIAVEPIQGNLFYLLNNIKKNGWHKQVEVFPVALGESSDILEIWGGGTGASLIKGWAQIPENYVTQVPVFTLDRIIDNQIVDKKALIIIDIEGAEYMLLKGAINILNNKIKPIWMIEITTTKHQPNMEMNKYFRKTFELFFENGYKAYTADDEYINICKSDLDLIESNEFKLKTHNFIFR